MKEKHNFTVLGGFQAEIMKYRDMEGARTGLVTTDLPVLNLTTDADSYTLKGLYKNWKNAGFFGRINYDYNGKLSGRRVTFVMTVLPVFVVETVGF